MEIDRNKLNACNASRKMERIAIADTLEAIALEQGATVTERRNEPALKGFSGQGIALRIECKGVGCMIDIDNLHGGNRALISWFNAPRELGESVRNFSRRFVRCIGDVAGRPHHKATSHPANWYSLAMMLEAGLMLAARGEAFEPVTA